jgi:hypothetical protein
MIAAAPTTVAPAVRATSIVSRVEPPVVTTPRPREPSRPVPSANPRRSRLPSCRSAKMAATQCAGDFLTDDDARGAERAPRRLPVRGHAPRWPSRRPQPRADVQNQGALQIAGLCRPEVSRKCPPAAPYCTESFQNRVGCSSSHRKPSIPFAPENLVRRTSSTHRDSQASLRRDRSD